MKRIKKDDSLDSVRLAVVNNQVKGYDSEPVFIRQAERAKELIRKYGWPGKVIPSSNCQPD